MSISAKIIADSISPEGVRLTTFQLRYPRFIHAEELTHRVISTGPELIEIVTPDGFMYDRNLSRNASSSRAIPVTKLITDVIMDPVIPVYWGKNQSGMQALEELDEDAKRQAIMCWTSAREAAIHWAQTMYNLGAHKQIANRIVEPYSHINVVATATDYANFYALRRHPDAQPEMKALADAMWEAQQASTPELLQPGEWHLPYFDEVGAEIYGIRGLTPLDAAIRVSVARCARVSYFTHDGKRPSIDEDLKLYDRLIGAVPLHASPAEHQATPDTLDDVGDFRNPRHHGNLTGWVQYRKSLIDEFIPG